jgi:MoxR-like ATPase
VGTDELGSANDVAERFLDNIETVVHGKREQIKLVVAALMCGGHVLLEDVPGTAKTVLARAIAQSIRGTQSSRIQCTPDLQPTDVTGLSIFNQRERDFEFRPGPVFANVVLVDEINRAMPKTQSALLEAMAEQQVTVDGETRRLEDPFLVMATQNPIEYEGTFPLPEAQLDRFFFKALVEFPSEDELLEIARRTTGSSTTTLEAVAGADEVLAAQKVAREVPIAEHVLRFAGRLIISTHPDRTELESVRRYVRFGASPRGLQTLVLAGKVRALLEGRFNVAFDDIAAVAHPALRHRIFLQFEAEADQVAADQLIDEILEKTDKTPSRD